MRLAPIALSTYSRLAHLQRTVEALQNNTLAAEADLFIFSDGPKPGDETKVRDVRAYLKNITGFASIQIIERQQNNRVFNNRQGMRMLLEQYGKMIFIEEDVITAPSFLSFMNEALDAYQANHRIFSVCGYCPPVQIPKNYPYDVFLHPRFNPWGFAIWKDRFDLIEMKIPKKVMKEVFLNPKNLYRFSRGGLDMIPLTLKNYFEFGDGLDGRIFAQQFVLGMLSVYPVRHLVENVGIDGSGLHKKKKPGFRVDLSSDTASRLSLPPNDIVDDEIARHIYDFRSGSKTQRAKWLLLAGTYLLRGIFLPQKKRMNPAP